MFSWFKYKNFPIFWKEYSKKFKQKQPNSLENTRFVIFDTETTGLDIISDRILSIGAIGIFNHNIDVADSLEIYLKQDQFKAETVEIHGILKEGKLTKLSEAEAMEYFIAYIENAVLVAHHTAFDIEMINAALKRWGCPN